MTETVFQPAGADGKRRIAYVADKKHALIERMGADEDGQPLMFVRRTGPSLEFTILKSGEASEFLVKELELRRGELDSNLSASFAHSCSLMIAPYTYLDVPVVDFFECEGVAIDAVSEVDNGGQPEVHVRWTHASPEITGGKFEGIFVFLPDKHWVLSRIDRSPDFKRGHTRWEVDYGDEIVDGVPLPIAYRQLTMRADSPAQIVQEVVSNSVTRNVPRNRFALSYYGLSDEIGSPPPSRFPYVLVTGAALALMIAIIWWRSRSTK